MLISWITLGEMLFTSEPKTFSWIMTFWWMRRGSSGMIFATRVNMHRWSITFFIAGISSTKTITLTWWAWAFSSWSVTFSTSSKKSSTFRKFVKIFSRTPRNILNWQTILSKKLKTFMTIFSSTLSAKTPKNTRISFKLQLISLAGLRRERSINLWESFTTFSKKKLIKKSSRSWTKNYSWRK